MSSTITAKWYPSASNEMFQGNLTDVAGKTFKMALLNSSGVYNASHTTFAQASNSNAYELAATGGYTAGGAAVDVTGTANSTQSSFTLAAAAAWTPATFTVDNAVLYESTTGKLMMHLAFSPALSLTGQDFQINPPIPAAKIALPA